jgi:hypothetical protein
LIRNALEKNRHATHITFLISDTLSSALDFVQSAHITVTKEVILFVLAEKNPEKKRIQQLMEADLGDIYFWNGEEACISYLAETINRKNEIAGILTSTLVKNNLVGVSKPWKLFLEQLVEAALYTNGNRERVGSTTHTHA